ncbi:MAG: tetratricopeptide repeat protein, partial [Candidatus Dormibacteraceae bacterium]
MPKVAHARRTICCHAAVALVLLGSISGVRAWPLLPAQQESVTKVPSARVIQSLPMDAASRGALTDAVKSRQYVQAEKILINAIRQNPESPRLLSFLGGIYFLNGDYLESAVAMKKAEQLAPLNNPDRFTLAMAYIVLNHSDWAQPEIERLTRS